MEVMQRDGMLVINGPAGSANLGDYVTSEQGFNQILEQLMQAAGPQGPLPATEAVINGLPRITFDEETLEKSPYKDCPVCKDDFAVGDEVMRIPCGHVCHPDCLQPWLRINGSCPVCRFSLVPDQNDSSSSPAAQNQEQGQGQGQQASEPEGTQSTITNILNRLWGQAGTNSAPPSPTVEMRSPPLGATQAPTTSPEQVLNLPAADATSGSQAPGAPAAPGQPDEPLQRAPSAAPSTPAPAPTEPEGRASGQASDPSATTAQRLPTAIPDDYRERHRRRERERHEIPPEDLD